MRELSRPLIILQFFVSHIEPGLPIALSVLLVLFLVDINNFVQCFGRQWHHIDADPDLIFHTYVGKSENVLTFFTAA
jgi:hypothetical protein